MDQSFYITQINDRSEKSICTRNVLESLPEWFGNKQSLEEYVEQVKDFPFWCACLKSGQYIGFFSAKIHYGHTGDLFVCGVLPEYQRRGIGEALYKTVESWFIQNGCNFVIVKTLSDIVTYEPYAKTRKFYEKLGFSPLITLTEMWDENNPSLIMLKPLSQI